MKLMKNMPAVTQGKEGKKTVKAKINQYKM